MSNTNNHNAGKLWSSPFVHHLFGAFTLTSIALFATHVGITKFLDGLAISSAQWLLTHHTDEVKTEGENGPVLISINSEDYRGKRFDTTSPLNRNELATGLKRLFDSKPKAVMIDLDLSPSTSKYKGSDYLDGVLDAAANRDKISLVLITPILSEISSTAEEWLRQRCKNKINFAFNSVESEFGIVLRYREQYPSLGVVARASIPEHKQNVNSPICAYLDAVHLVERQLEHPSQPHDQKWSINDLDKMVWQRASETDAKHIEWKRLQHIELISWEELVSDSEKKLEKSFGNRLVFIGSQYDQHDWFQSPLGPRPGVQVHMAVAYSNVSETHIPLYYLEVSVGTLLGIFGAQCWKALHNFQKEHVERVSYERLTVWGHTRRFATRGLLFLTPALTGTIIFLLIMNFSVSSLKNGVWLNPAPLAIGISFDILMLHEETNHEFKLPGRLSWETTSTFLLYPLRWFFQIPLIVCAHLFLICELIH